MKILALDIGTGTEDILVYEENKTIENCVKMILPSPSLVYAKKIKEATFSKKDLFIEGDIIGGGAFTSALKAHLKRGHRVLMTKEVAYTVRNSLDEVKQFGIEIVDSPVDFQGKRMRISEVNLLQLDRFLSEIGESILDVKAVAIAVQDHGVSPVGMSNRRFRLQKMRELLERDSSPENLAFMEEQIPPFFLRMKSAVKASKRYLSEAKVMLMDTSPAAVIGCLEDPIVNKFDPVLAVNVGNSHTMAAIISKRKIIGMVEHHTGLLNSQKIENFIKDFANGELTDEKVFEDGGHGLFFLSDPPGLSKIKLVAVTGPKRSVLKETNINFHFASPAGDVMMTGPVALIKLMKKKYV